MNEEELNRKIEEQKKKETLLKKQQQLLELERKNKEKEQKLDNSFLGFIKKKVKEVVKK